jgi:hypothetical protein
MITVQNGVLSPSVSEAVLFPFDDYTIPFTAGLRLHLVPGKRPGQNNPIVVPIGEPGDPDDHMVRFYGTVIPVDGELRMWYMAQGTRDDPERDGKQFRVCYATSQDGVHWEKPELGLVEYEGSKKNNIVNLREGRRDFACIPIIHDPEDPDPNRRFKIVFESWIYSNQFAVATSPDGLNWTESPNNPVGPGLEQTGLIRHNGCYYVNGQGGHHFGSGRVMSTYASYDFETWTEASCLSFRRDAVSPQPMPTEWNVGEEVHLGAGLWDRGNVILGVYDIWHGHPSSDRLMVMMDLGLLISHDALHFQEPIKDFRFVAAFEELGELKGKPPTISHGQGMCNWGDKTLLWYENWGNPPVQVRLASWARDRLGYYEPLGKGGGHCLSCALDVSGDVKLSANVDGLGQHSELRFELLDEHFHPIDGFSGDAAAVLTALDTTADGQDIIRVPGDAGAEESGEVPGLRVPVEWAQGKIPGGKGPVRIKTTFGGVRPEDAHLYAMYLESD